MFHLVLCCCLDNYAQTQMDYLLPKLRIVLASLNDHFAQLKIAFTYTNQSIVLPWFKDLLFSLLT